MQQPFWVKEAREGLQLQIKKQIAHKRINKNNPSSGTSGGLPNGEKNKDNMLNIATPTDQATEQDMRELLDQLPAPVILLVTLIHTIHSGISIPVTTLLMGSFLSRTGRRLCVKRPVCTMFQTVA